MIIEKVLIIDHVNGEAGEYAFGSNANLLVSQDNSQGKSSLLKTLYYGLGLGIKQFPSKWDPTKMIIKLSLHNERTNEKLYVIRVNDLFYVSDNKDSLNLSGYTKWLSAQLGIDMKLTISKTNTTKSISYPSALITPFYVDQDESWSNRFFSATNEVQMYRDVPKNIFDYILSITDDDELNTKQELKRLMNQKKTIEAKRSSINEVYIDYVDSNSDDHEHDVSAIVNPIENNKKNIDLFIHLMDEANKKYIQDKAIRIKLQRDLDQLKKSSEEYRSILKMLNSDYDYIKSICKHCNSELTEEQVRTRMEVSTDIFEINYLIATTSHQISKAEQTISQALIQEQESSIEYARLSKELDTNIEVNSIAEYIEEASKKKSQVEFATIIKNLDSDIGSLDSDIKEKRKEMKEAVKKTQELAETIARSYREYVNELSIIMRGSNVNDIEFENFTAPKSSGVNVNQTYLGIYLAYMRLVDTYGRYKLPFCIDSFIKNETAGNRLDDMFKATEKFLLDIHGQSIFSAIEEYVQKYMSDNEKFHRIQIGERLLSADNFDKSYEEIKSIVIQTN